VVALAPDARAQDETEVEIVSEPPEEPPVTAPPPSEPPAAAPSPAEALSTETPAEQPMKPKEPLGHLRVGGGLGFGFGSGFVSVAVSPQVSYIFKRFVEPGVALRYEYSKDSFASPDVTWHTYGGSLFARLYPIQQLFFLIEGELINTGWKQGGFSSGRQNYGNLLLGGGYMIGMGRGAFMGMSLKFAVFRNPFYPTVFPIISVGAGYGF
jgi:hypothetical protein